MKKRNLFLMLVLMFVGVTTLSSWRLFGRDDVDGDGTAIQMPGGGNTCIEKGTQQSYFFGFKTKEHEMQSTFPCDGVGEPGGWVNAPE
jgi:hypothetical protein